MKKEDSEILKKLGKNLGFKVPDNYFADFSKNLTDSLPEIHITEEEKPTLWSRISTYVYMAAMFAGIWCMFHVFDIYNGTAGKVSPKTEMASGVKGDLNTVKAAKAADNAKMSYKDSIEAGSTAGDNAPLKVAQ